MTQIIRPHGLPSPHVVSRQGTSFMDIFAAALIVGGLVTAVLLGAAALLGALWLVLWLARQVVGLMS